MDRIYRPARAGLFPALAHADSQASAARLEERMQAFAMRIRHTGVWAHNGEDWFRVAFHDTYEHLDQ